MNYPFTQGFYAGSHNFHSGYELGALCSAWNHATSPSMLMTDREHAKARTYARAIRNRIERIGLIEGIHYRELSNGSLWPINSFDHYRMPLLADGSGPTHTNCY